MPAQGDSRPMPLALSVGGVPEHFNLPWVRLAEEADIAWREYPSGTGAMAAALDADELDIAMLLTEGAVAAIANGGRFRIAQRYTETPLIWGIHVSPHSTVAQVDELSSARFAISRTGSGSHLMAFALARARGWRTSELRFVTVGGLDGAITAFERRAADVFLWEKFMTQPRVDDGTFSRIGEFSATWPAFVICVSERALASRTPAVRNAIARALDLASRISSAPSAAEEIAARYRLTIEAAREWLRSTRWAANEPVSEGAFDEVLDVLQALELVPRSPERPVLVAPI